MDKTLKKNYKLILILQTVGFAVALLAGLFVFFLPYAKTLFGLGQECSLFERMLNVLQNLKDLHGQEAIYGLICPILEAVFFLLGVAFSLTGLIRHAIKLSKFDQSADEEVVRLQTVKKKRAHFALLPSAIYAFLFIGLFEYLYSGKTLGVNEALVFGIYEVTALIAVPVIFLAAAIALSVTSWALERKLKKSIVAPQVK